MAPNNTMGLCPWSKAKAEDRDTFLGDAINIATRSVHTKLNKLILLRLPLAIPPRATDSSSYVSGILHIAPLYICFESLWHAAVHNSSSPASGSPCTASLPPTNHLPQPTPRIAAILSDLFMPGLQRSARLRSDLRTLTNQSEAEVQRRLEEASGSGRLGEMVGHIRRSVERHPHVLLSYAWVLYMALFSGGRIIRATLENAGRGNPTFWACPTTAAGAADAAGAATSTAAAGKPSGQKEAAGMEEAQPNDRHGPLQFFHFPSPQDGEDLKAEFKARFAAGGRLLTDGEREDVVREAVCIFESLILVIAQLDDVCHTSLHDLQTPGDRTAGPAGSGSGAAAKGSGFRIRDSVLVTKERAARRTGSEKEGGAALEEVDEAGEEEVKEDEDKDSSSLSSSSSSSEDGRPVVDVDPGFAARLAKAVHFDAKLPVPERPPSGNALLPSHGKAQPRQGQNDGAMDAKSSVDGKLQDPETSLAWNVAACVGSAAVALGMMYYRQ